MQLLVKNSPIDGSLLPISYFFLYYFRIKLLDRLSSTYILNIKDEVNNVTYKLNFPGSVTILDLKSNIYTLNDVPVRNQLWKGWPSTVKSDLITLAQSGIPYPEHNLSVGRIPSKETAKVNFPDSFKKQCTLVKYLY